MTELQKWVLINRAGTIDELKWTIDLIGDITISNGNIWSSKKMNDNIDKIIRGYDWNLVTRNYGIRQQLIYLLK